MTARHKLLPAIVAAAALLCSCQEQSAPSSPNEPLAAAQGRKAALEAASLPKGSMQQEKALLHIRAIEHQIRQAGDSLAADAYKSAAEAVLDSVGVFKN